MTSPPIVPFSYSLRETTDPEEFGVKALHPWGREFLLGTDFGIVLAFNCDPIEPDYALRSSCCMGTLALRPTSDSRPRYCTVCGGASSIPYDQAIASRTSCMSQTGSCLKNG